MDCIFCFIPQIILQIVTLFVVSILIFRKGIICWIIQKIVQTITPRLAYFESPFHILAVFFSTIAIRYTTYDQGTYCNNTKCRCEFNFARRINKY